MSYHRAPLCSADCRYRSLYEGSQTSLTDMAARQASALGRVNRLRQGVVHALKHAFPTDFTTAEQRLGRRMSDPEVNDELLLSYVSAFIERSAATSDQASANSSAHDQLREALAARGLHMPPGNDLRVWAAALASPASEPAAPSATAPAPVANPTGTPAEADELHSLFAGDGDISALLVPTADDAHQPVTQALADHSTTPTQHQGVDVDELDDLFAEDPDSGDLALDALIASGEPAAEEQPPEVEGADDLDALFADDLDAPVERTGEPGPPLRPRTSPAQASKRSSPRRGQRTRRAVRTVASSATVDIPTLHDGPPQAPQVKTHQALLAAVAVPRPVFLNDLQAVAGSSAALDAWETACRGDSSINVRFIAGKRRHQARGALVIPTEQLRDAAVEFTNSWWSQCLDRYRGAKLYELAVLLHRVGADIVSHHFTDDVAVLRVANSARGVSAVVMLLDPNPGTDTATHRALVGAIGDLIDDRLTHLAVLVTSPQDTCLRQLAEVIETEVTERGWSPAWPIIGQTSWEYTENKGATATQLLSQPAAPV